MESLYRQTHAILIGETVRDELGFILMGGEVSPTIGKQEKARAFFTIMVAALV